MSERAPVIELRDVTFRYPGGEDLPPVVEDVTLQVTFDDYLGLIGPNGGGKTTLLKLMLGLHRPQRGTVRVLGQPPARVRSRIGYVPQHAKIDTSVPATVLDVVLMGRLSGSTWGMRFRDQDLAMARTALDQAGVLDLAGRPLGSLSGGQRQRVLIARALASEAEVLLLDEPMAGVDAPMEQSLHELLERLNERFPIVIVSHDVAFVSSELKHIACINRHLVCHGASEITAEMIAAAYGEHDHLKIVQHQEECPTRDEHEDHP